MRKLKLLHNIVKDIDIRHFFVWFWSISMLTFVSEADLEFCKWNGPAFNINRAQLYKISMYTLWAYLMKPVSMFSRYGPRMSCKWGRCGIHGIPGTPGSDIGWGHFSLVCWSLTSLCHSNGHIETMPAREINPFTALTRIRSQLLRTQWSTSNHQRVDTTTPLTAQPSGLAGGTLVIQFIYLI